MPTHTPTGPFDNGSHVRVRAVITSLAHVIIGSALDLARVAATEADKIAGIDIS
jgi:hypothetical protein